MPIWYGFAVLALLLLGAQRFLYKVSAERKCNTAWTTLSFMATVAVLSTILVFVLKEPVSNMPPGYSFIIMLSHRMISGDKAFLLVKERTGKADLLYWIQERQQLMRFEL